MIFTIDTGGHRIRIEITESDGGEVAAVKAQSRLANATSVEPSASGLIVHKHIFIEDAGSGA